MGYYAIACNKRGGHTVITCTTPSVLTMNRWHVHARRERSLQAPSCHRLFFMHTRRECSSALIFRSALQIRIASTEPMHKQCAIGAAKGAAKGWKGRGKGNGDGNRTMPVNGKYGKARRQPASSAYRYEAPATPPAEATAANEEEETDEVRAYTHPRTSRYARLAHASNDRLRSQPFDVQHSQLGVGSPFIGSVNCLNASRS